MAKLWSKTNPTYSPILSPTIFSPAPTLISHSTHAMVGRFWLLRSVPKISPVQVQAVCVTLLGPGMGVRIQFALLRPVPCLSQAQPASWSNPPCLCNPFPTLCTSLPGSVQTHHLWGWILYWEASANPCAGLVDSNTLYGMFVILSSQLKGPLPRVT